MGLFSCDFFFFFSLIRQKATFHPKKAISSSCISSLRVLLTEQGLASETIATNYTRKIIPLREQRPNFISLRQSPDALFMYVLKLRSEVFQIHVIGKRKQYKRVIVSLFYFKLATVLCSLLSRCISVKGSLCHAKKTLQV